ncbi:hypothetical protein ACFX5Q_23455 [Mesorhizobium sp. IMUNJ 23033]|uniref:hypothetical protein n=1 Tax=Mesorhizobium sp. IMUNJ 23033 TaxID=3378039 RepID=UPI00384B99D1
MILAGILGAMTSSLALQLLLNNSDKPLPVITILAFVVSHVAAAASAVFAFGVADEIAASASPA